MTEQESIKDIALRKFRRLKEDRQSWEPTWKELAKYCLPYGGRWDGDVPNDGRKKGQDIIDSRALRAVRNLAAFMFTGLTSPSRPWFRLGVANADMADNKAVKSWLEVVEERLYQAFARSNFYLVAHQQYEELGVFGTSCSYIEADFETFIRCAIFTAGRYYLAVDAKGRVDTVCRVVPMTARQMEQEFGEDALPAQVRAALQSETTYFDVLHAVFPNPKADPEKADPQAMPYVSVYVMLGEDSVLRHSGYQEMPYMCPRWSVSGEDVYGRGPGLDALSEIKTLQLERKDRLAAVHKAVNPPVVAPAGYENTVNSAPGGVTPEPLGGAGQGFRPLYAVQPNLATIIAETSDSRQIVDSLFFNDLVLMVDENPKMTATEVLERKQEKMLMLGPIVERLQSEYLNPIIDRVFGLLFRAGLLPDPPQEAQGAEIKVEYISPLAQAQRRTGIDAISGATAFAMQAAQGDPAALDRLDIPEAVQRYAELAGVPAALVRSDEEVAQIQQARAQAQAQAQKVAAMQEAVPMLAEAMHKAGQVDLDKNTLAGKVLGTDQQQGAASPPPYQSGSAVNG